MGILVIFFLFQWFASPFKSAFHFSLAKGALRRSGGGVQKVANAGRRGGRHGVPAILVGDPIADKRRRQAKVAARAAASTKKCADGWAACGRGGGAEGIAEDLLLNRGVALGHKPGRRIRPTAQAGETGLGQVAFDLGPRGPGRVNLIVGNRGRQRLKILVDRALGLRTIAGRGGVLGVRLDERRENRICGSQVPVLNGGAEVVKASIQRGSLRKLHGIADVRRTRCTGHGTHEICNAPRPKAGRISISAAAPENFSPLKGFF